MVKVTFTLDEQTVERLRRRASRLGKPQSHVVREAVRDYEARSTKLSDEERARMLAIVDRMVKEPPTRKAADVDAVLGEIRASRRRACALASGAALWTLDTRDFRDIPGLALLEP
jgi:predicted transcriptional regulator